MGPDASSRGSCHGSHTTQYASERIALNLVIRAIRTALQKAVGPEAEGSGVADDQMIEEAHAYGCRG